MKHKKDEPYDLSEASSKRSGGEEATIAARQAESDDVNEALDRGSVDIGEDSFSGENRVTTSLNDDE